MGTQVTQKLIIVRAREGGLRHFFSDTKHSLRLLNQSLMRDSIHQKQHEGVNLRHILQGSLAVVERLIGKLGGGRGTIVELILGPILPGFWIHGVKGGLQGSFDRLEVFNSDLPFLTIAELVRIFTII